MVAFYEKTSHCAWRKDGCLTAGAFGQDTLDLAPRWREMAAFSEDGTSRETTNRWVAVLTKRQHEEVDNTKLQQGIRAKIDRRGFGQPSPGWIVLGACIRRFLRLGVRGRQQSNHLRRGPRNRIVLASRVGYQQVRGTRRRLAEAVGGISGRPINK
jgi:hypothetical protein